MTVLTHPLCGTLKYLETTRVQVATWMSGGRTLDISLTKSTSLHTHTHPTHTPPPTHTHTHPTHSPHHSPHPPTLSHQKITHSTRTHLILHTTLTFTASSTPPPLLFGPTHCHTTTAAYASEKNQYTRLLVIHLQSWK